MNTSGFIRRANSARKAVLGRPFINGTSTPVGATTKVDLVDAVTRERAAVERNARSLLALAPLLVGLIFLVEVLLFSGGDTNLTLSILSSISFGSALFVVGGRVLPLVLAAVALTVAHVWGDDTFAPRLRRSALIGTLYLDLALVITAPILTVGMALLGQYATGRFYVLKSKKRRAQRSLKIAEHAEPQDTVLYKIWTEVKQGKPEVGVGQAWNTRVAELASAASNRGWRDAVSFFLHKCLTG